MNILGISAFYHDSAACLVRDGEIIAAAQEERFTRKKHDYRFPAKAIEYCLAEGGIGPEQLDLVAFYDKPLLKFDRLLETYVSYAPLGFRLFLMGLPLWLKQKLYTPRELDQGLQSRYKGRYVFLEHHESHAASAFFPSPFDEAAILTLDGVGEWATGSISVGRGNQIRMLKELRFPHSLGLLYSAFTYFTGFKVNSGEYKLMGLAPYGEPIYADLIREKMLDVKPDGSFRMDMSYFAYTHKDVMTAAKFDRLFGPPRAAESPITQREMDLAASIQLVTEEIMLKIASYAHELTGLPNLCLAGGVALNCVGNGKILREGPFDQVWIQPAAGDAGGALGAALFVWHQLLDNERKPNGRDSQKGSLLGPAYSNAEIQAFLDRKGAVYRHYASEDALCDAVAELVAAENVVGHCAGRMEFGPRALGARSILGDARSRKMQATMNVKIKFRESFRPFAPAVLREDVDEFFEMRPSEDSPYMLLVAPVREEKRLPIESRGEKGLDKLKQVRSVVPAITHVDNSARVQTIDAERNPRFHRILTAFKRKTGSPVVINTSFNVRGEPIVNTPEDSYRCFMHTNMDVLVLENFVLLKKDQPEAKEIDIDAYLAEFGLD
ncbi:MAG TPA: carbamoyltransferase [Myxococcota bacterium]|nr:carbamoyltransferase [Myxococcota bacterium]